MPTEILRPTKNLFYLRFPRWMSEISQIWALLLPCKVGLKKEFLLPGKHLLLFLFNVKKAKNWSTEIITPILSAKKVIWMLVVGSCCTELRNPLKSALPPPPSQRGWRPAEAVLDTLMQHNNPLLSSFSSSLQPLTGGRARWRNEQRATQHSQSNGGEGGGENNMGGERRGAGGCRLVWGYWYERGAAKRGTECGKAGARRWLREIWETGRPAPEARSRIHICILCRNDVLACRREFIFMRFAAADN